MNEFQALDLISNALSRAVALEEENRQLKNIINQMKYLLADKGGTDGFIIGHPRHHGRHPRESGDPARTGGMDSSAIHVSNTTPVSTRIKHPSHQDKARAARTLKDLLAEGPVDAVTATSAMGFSKFICYKIRDQLGAKTTLIHGWPRVNIWHYPDQAVNPDDFTELIAERTRNFRRKTNEYRARKSQPETKKSVMGKARKECVVSTIPISEFYAKVKNAREAESKRQVPAHIDS